MDRVAMNFALDEGTGLRTTSTWSESANNNRAKKLTFWSTVAVACPSVDPIQFAELPRTDAALKFADRLIS